MPNDVNVDQKKTAWHQEQERRSGDLLRVYNPTDEDYVIEWDRRGGTKRFRVKAKGEEVMTRFIAEKYIREMYQKIITEEADVAVLKENQRRVEKGLAEMNKWDEQYRFENPLLNVKSERARQIISLLYVGVESEWGVDRVDEPEETPADRPVFQSALETVQEERASGVTHTAGAQEFKCDWPGCTFTSSKSIGLIGHKRTHRTEAAKVEAPVDVDAKKNEALAGVSQ